MIMNEQEIIEYKHIQYEGDKLAVIITKEKAYLCPSVFVGSHLEKERKRVFYCSTAQMMHIRFEELPTDIQDWLNKICPEVHSKKLFFGLTSKEGNPTLFYSKKVI